MNAKLAMKLARQSCRLLRLAFLLSVLAIVKSQLLLPCAPGVTNKTVSNSAQAFDLTEALLCSGGQFEVTWVGQVVLDSTIAISDGTSLKVLGSSSGGSVVDGGGLHQLFNVSSNTSILELQGLSLVNGASTLDGGAVALANSSLEVNDCSFDGNTAAGYGGANRV